MAKLKNNSLLKQSLRFWKTDKAIPSDGILKGNYLEIGSNKVGYITSSMQIDNDHSIGLALIRRKHLSLKNIVLVDNIGTLELNKPIGFKGLDHN